MIQKQFQILKIFNNLKCCQITDNGLKYFWYSGTYSNVIRATNICTCIPCPQGTYSKVPGASSIEMCLKCPKGYHLPQLGEFENQCLPCLMGTYSEFDGSENCTSCPAGTL